MSKLSELSAKFKELGETIRESEAFQQLKSKYEELDSQTRFYINIGAVVGTFLVIVISVLSGVAKVNGLKNEINEREELIGYLQRSADNIKQLKAQQEAMRGNKDVNSALNQFVESIGSSAGLTGERISVSAERPGKDTKEAKELLVDVTLKQVNLRQLTRFMFSLTDQGSPRSLNIQELTIDTKNDPAGWLEANLTIAGYKAK